MSSAANATDVEHALPVVEVDLNYSVPVARSCVDLVEPDRTDRPLETRRVKIHDVRAIRDRLDLDREGFILVDHKSAITNFQETSEFDRPYHEELCRLVLERSGADMALPARKYLALRQPPLGDHQVDYLKAPADHVHLDFTQGNFMKLVHLTLEIEGQGGRNFSRVALYQVWRPLSPPPQDYPFAMVDSTTVEPDDFIVLENVIGPREDPGNILQGRLGLYRERHRWCYFSDMRQDEVIIFKGNDTRFGDSQSVLHAAFDNRPNEPHANPRYSVEARIFAFWN